MGRNVVIEAKTHADVIKRILKHCGLWKEIVPRATPIEAKPPVSEPEETQYDYSFFDRICALEVKEPKEHYTRNRNI